MLMLHAQQSVLNLIVRSLMSWAFFRQASTTHLACRSCRLQDLLTILVAFHARTPLLSPRLPGRHVVLLSRTRGTAGLQPDRGLRFLRYYRYSHRFSIHGPAIHRVPTVWSLKNSRRSLK